MHEIALNAIEIADNRADGDSLKIYYKTLIPRLSHRANGDRIDIKMTLTEVESLQNKVE